jgi:CubicO group peptidase (beta-lactamase class C family)
MKKMKSFFKKIVIVLILLGIGYLFLPTYLQNALQNFFPKIYDYNIFHNRNVTNISGEVHSWKISERYNNDSLSIKHQSYIRQMKSVAFMVIQNDEIIHEQYWDGSDKDMISGLFSATKTIVSMLIGCAIDDGYIGSVEDNVGQYIDEFNQGEKSTITIKDLLTMSSGLNWDESYSSPFSITTKAYYGEDLWSLIKNLKVIDHSGKKFKYLSGDTQVLAFVLKNVTGKSLAEYASEKLWSKIGAENIAKWSLDSENGMEKAYCCFNTTARDFAKFGKLLLNNGKWNGKQIISEQYVKAMQTPASYLENPKDHKMVDFYGYQTWIMNYKGMKIPYMRGMKGQYVFVIPEKNAIVVRMGHTRSSDREDMHSIDSYKYIDIAMELL